MKRLHADPVFAARRDARASACMKRLLGDPAFLAKRLAAGQPIPISPETRAAIVAALRVTPNAKRVADKFSDVSYGTVLKFAKAGGIELKRGGYGLRRRTKWYVIRPVEEERRKRREARAALMKCIRRQSRVDRRPRIRPRDARNDQRRSMSHAEYIDGSPAPWHVP